MLSPWCHYKRSLMDTMWKAKRVCFLLSATYFCFFLFLNFCCDYYYMIYYKEINNNIPNGQIKYTEYRHFLVFITIPIQASK